MDNRLLNVNGKSQAHLLTALQVAFEQLGMLAQSFTVTSEFGMILSWSSESNSGLNSFPVELSHDLVTPIVWTWLQNVKIKDFKLQQWEGDYDHDGHNSIGWRVYVDDWGHVGDIRSAICAVKPVWLWHGK